MNSEARDLSHQHPIIKVLGVHARCLLSSLFALRYAVVFTSPVNAAQMFAGILGKQQSSGFVLEEVVSCLMSIRRRAAPQSAGLCLAAALIKY